MPDYQLVPVDHDPFTSFASVDHDPFSSDQDEALSRSMTHQAPDPTSEEVSRRVRQTGQNLYNTFLGPAERLGRATTSGTLDVTDPKTTGEAIDLVGAVAGTRMPFAGAGELGAAGGRISSQVLREMLAAGKSYGDIAQEHGVSRGAVAGMVRDLGLRGQTTRTAPVPYTPEQKQRITDLIASGASNEKIKQEMGKASSYSGMTYLKRLAGARDPSGSAKGTYISNQAYRAIAERMDAGKTDSEIAGELGFQTKTISKVRTAEGVGSMEGAPEWFKEEMQQLNRNVLERGRSGRPIQTGPLPIGNENAILEAGAGLNEARYQFVPVDHDPFASQ